MGSAPEPVDGFQGTFADISKSKHKVTIKSESTKLEPFQLDFPALITQSVRWASVDVRITKAQQVRGASDVVDSEDTGQLDPNQIYVRLELAIANKDTTETNYYDRATWDLKLANGTRLTSVNPLGVSVLPGDEATAVV